MPALSRLPKRQRADQAWNELARTGTATIEDTTTSEKQNHVAYELQYLSLIAAPRKDVFCVKRNYRESIMEGNSLEGRDPNKSPSS
jgi:2-keto-4-pentenoate hydratase/2-oxohepta-3-ene-1,7-dioic acid hydratase in catechol pathway